MRLAGWSDNIICVIVSKSAAGKSPEQAFTVICNKNSKFTGHELPRFFIYGIILSLTNKKTSRHFIVILVLKIHTVSCQIREYLKIWRNCN